MNICIIVLTLFLSSLAFISFAESPASHYEPINAEIFVINPSNCEGMTSEECVPFMDEVKRYLGEMAESREPFFVESGLNSSLIEVNAANCGDKSLEWCEKFMNESFEYMVFLYHHKKRASR